ncbi:TetR/AcrR family transcriptional regulator [Rhodopirellula sallentina]|uniref:TetR family transcriptional regulator n=1 Tax=Rhodopirellula sallentina SM41 TaxID=1263870 RepID=M5UPF9_9BACT|nr:TetR/AcrR family transcriptional regulator [Rhodopirellula sallentina]EMI57893.1 TetR family transcriptional regulator [Rhodopirellula sallentina SM41]
MSAKKVKKPIQGSRRDGTDAVSQLRKSDRTRQSILDGALEFLWTHPFRDLTIKELMLIAGISRSAFYQYFSDVHELMEALLRSLEEDIFVVASRWLEGEGDPVRLLEETMSGLVSVCYKRGPILRAVADAAPMDERLEKSWKAFLQDFDDAVTARIEQHQAAGLIKPFEARPVAIALNRMDAYLLIHQFGRRPRGNRESVKDAILRLWISTLYGEEKVATSASGRRAKRTKTSSSKNS